MKIRLELPADIIGIHMVEAAAFNRPAEADLVDRLRENGKVTLSLVAEEDAIICGHVLFSPVVLQSEDGEFHAVGLGPVAVDPTLQRQGIGATLIREGLMRLREAQAPVVFVEGNPSYYGRFGFRDAEQVGISCEFNPPPGCFMLLELRPGSLGGRQGVVHYSEEFQSVG
jgi:putative acetyltransferase